MKAQNEQFKAEYVKEFTEGELKGHLEIAESPIFSSQEHALNFASVKKDKGEFIDYETNNKYKVLEIKVIKV